MKNASWSKLANGKWGARARWCDFTGRHIVVEARDGRETLCRITGTVPALGEETKANLERYITIEVERETKSLSQLMREVPQASRAW